MLLEPQWPNKRPLLFAPPILEALCLPCVHGGSHWGPRPAQWGLTERSSWAREAHFLHLVWQEWMVVLGTSPCTALYTHRKCSSYSARPVMCSHAIDASWWNTKNTGKVGWMLKRGLGGLWTCRLLGSWCIKILQLLGWSFLYSCCGDSSQKG